MSVVVKVGGSILGQGVSTTILDDIKRLSDKEKLVLVHGGGREVTQMAEKLGKKQTFVVSPEGIRSRYTDKETASIYTMVMAGILNKEMVAALQKVGVNAVGLSGVDGGLLRAERKKRLVVVENGRKRAIDGGYTGKITGVNSELLKMLVDSKFTPLVSPIAMSEEYEFLNVDGDRAAAYVAGALKAKAVLFLTDVPGILMNDRLLRHLTVAQARELMPTIGHGMEKKVLACLEALEMGVGEALIASGLIENPISAALSHSECTVIVNG